MNRRGVTPWIHIPELGSQPIVGNERAGRHIEQPFRALLPPSRPVAEANHPLVVGQLEGRPCGVELVLGQPDPPVRKIANHRRRQWPVGLAATGRAKNQFMRPGDRGGLFRQDGRGESLDPLDVDTGFRGYLSDRPSAAKSPLHLTRAKPALYLRPRRGWRRRRRYWRVRRSRLIYLLEQIVV